MTLTNKLKQMRRREEGFTIVELLIVIIVIAILAALVIAAYVGIQQRARDAERQSDVRNLVTAVQAYATIEDGTYPTCAQVLDGTVENVDDDAKTGPGFEGTAAFSVGTPTSETQDQYYCAEDPEAGEGLVFGYWSETDNAAVYRMVGDATEPTP